MTSSDEQSGAEKGRDPHVVISVLGVTLTPKFDEGIATRRGTERSFEDGLKDSKER